MPEENYKAFKVYDPTLSTYGQVPTAASYETSRYDQDFVIPETDLGIALQGMRAENQGLGMELATAGANLVPNIALSMVENAGYLFDLEDWSNMIQNNKANYGNALTEWASRNKNQFGEVYRKNSDAGFDISDSAWWVSNGAGLVESLAAYGLMGYGVGTALSKGATGLTKALGAYGKTKSAIEGAAQLGTSLTLAYSEGAMTGAQVYKDVYSDTRQRKRQEIIDQGIKQYGEENITEEYLKYADETAANFARGVAGEAATKAVRINTGVNTFLNLPETGVLFRSMSSSRYIDDALKLERGELAKDAIERLKAFDTDKYLTKQAIRHKVKETGSEMLEEMVNVYAEEEGKNVGREATGQDVKTLGDMLADDDIWAAGFWGAIGGSMNGFVMGKMPKWVTQEDGTKVRTTVGAYNKEQVAAKYEEQLTDLQDRLTEFVDARDALETASKSGDERAYKEAADKVFSYNSFNSIVKGTEEQLLNDYENILSLTPEEAAKQGFASDYKERAAEKIQSVKQNTAEWNKIQDRHASQDLDQAGFPETIFQQHINVQNNRKIIEENTIELAKLEAEIAQINTLRGTDLTVTSFNDVESSIKAVEHAFEMATIDLENILNLDKFDSRTQKRIVAKLSNMYGNITNARTQIEEHLNELREKREDLDNSLEIQKANFYSFIDPDNTMSDQEKFDKYRDVVVQNSIDIDALAEGKKTLEENRKILASQIEELRVLKSDKGLERFKQLKKEKMAEREALDAQAAIKAREQAEAKAEADRIAAINNKKKVAPEEVTPEEEEIIQTAAPVESFEEGNYSGEGSSLKELEKQYDDISDEANNSDVDGEVRDSSDELISVGDRLISGSNKLAYASTVEYTEDASGIKHISLKLNPETNPNLLTDAYVPGTKLKIKKLTASEFKPFVAEKEISFTDEVGRRIIVANAGTTVTFEMLSHPYMQPIGIYNEAGEYQAMLHAVSYITPNRIVPENVDVDLQTLINIRAAVTDQFQDITINSKSNGKLNQLPKFYTLSELIDQPVEFAIATSSIQLNTSKTTPVENLANKKGYKVGQVYAITVMPDGRKVAIPVKTTKIKETPQVVTELMSALDAFLKGGTRQDLQNVFGQYLNSVFSSDKLTEDGNSFQEDPNGKDRFYIDFTSTNVDGVIFGRSGGSKYFINSKTKGSDLERFRNELASIIQESYININFETLKNPDFVKKYVTSNVRFYPLPNGKVTVFDNPVIGFDTSTLISATAPNASQGIPLGTAPSQTLINKGVKLGFTKEQVIAMSKEERGLVRTASSKDDIVDLYNKYNPPATPKSTGSLSNVESFETSQGSIYNVLPNGKTQRFKTATGELNEPNDLIVFVKFNNAQQEQDFLAAQNRLDDHKLYVVDDEGNIYNTNEQVAGKDVKLVIVKNGKIIQTVETSLAPIIGYNTFDQRRYEENGEGYRSTHLGNKVTKINYKTPPSSASSIEIKRKEVRAAIQKAGQGEGGQFFVTLSDGTREAATRISLVGDELGVGNKGDSVDLAVIDKIENPDGTVLYDTTIPESLKTVENTAKAFEDIKKQTGKSVAFDLLNSPSYGVKYDTGKPIEQIIAEAYHKAKAGDKSWSILSEANTNNEALIKAVEAVLNPTIVKPKVAPAPQVQTIEQIKNDIAVLRAKEQAAYAAMPDPNDTAAKDKIYEEYNKLITPLINKAEADIERRKQENLKNTGDAFDYISSTPREDGKFNAFYTKTKEAKVFDTYEQGVAWIESKYKAELDAVKQVKPATTQSSDIEAKKAELEATIKKQEEDLKKITIGTPIGGIEGIKVGSRVDSGINADIIDEFDTDFDPDIAENDGDGYSIVTRIQEYGESKDGKLTKRPKLFVITFNNKADADAYIEKRKTKVEEYKSKLGTGRGIDRIKEELAALAQSQSATTTTPIPITLQVHPSITKEKERLKKILSKLEYKVPDSSGVIRLNSDGSFKEYGSYDEENGGGEWNSVTTDINFSSIKNDYQKVKKIHDTNIKLNDLINSKLVDDINLLVNKYGSLKELKKALEPYSFEQIGSTASLDYDLVGFIQKGLSFNKIDGITKAVEELLGESQPTPVAETPTIDIERKKRVGDMVIDYVWKRLAQQGITNADPIIGTRDTIDNVDFDKFWSNVLPEDLQNLIKFFKEQKKQQLQSFKKYQGAFDPTTGTFTSDDTSFYDNKIADVKAELASIDETIIQYGDYRIYKGEDGTYDVEYYGEGIIGDYVSTKEEAIAIADRHKKQLENKPTEPITLTSASGIGFEIEELDEDDYSVTTTEDLGVKPGVEELFDSNPELANEVYEALGFNNVITPDDKIIWGHPAIGKTTAKEQKGFLDFDTDFKPLVAKKLGLPESQQNSIGLNEWRKTGSEEDFNKAMREVWNIAKIQAKNQNKILMVSDMIFLRENQSDFDKIINVPSTTFIDRATQRGDNKENLQSWKDKIDNTLKNVDSKKIITTDKYLSDLFITPQQKQQALQLYSQYLDSVFPDSQVKDIVYHGTPEGQFENFDITKAGRVTGNSTKGIYFSDSKKTADFYAEGSIDFSQFESLEEYEAVKKAKTFSAVLNAKNLKLVNNPQAQEKQGDAILRTKEKLSDKGFIGEIDYAHQFIVFELEQIHILGSKQDIDGFKEFTKSGKQIEKSVSLQDKVNTLIQEGKATKFCK